MAFSTQIITDLTAVKNNVRNNGPSAATTANAIAPNGPIIDYVGMAENVLLKAQELKVALNQLIVVTDSGSDVTNLGLLQGVVNDLV